jgi:hypothetical protein
VARGSSKAGNGARSSGARSSSKPEPESIAEQILGLRQEMFVAAENLQFETAARIRDEIKKLSQLAGGVSTELVKPAAARSAKPVRRKVADGRKRR